MRLVPLLLIYTVACSPLASGVAPPADWRAPEQREHPLVGRIWSAHEARFVGPDALVDAALAADFVLLGEKHDNPDHHRLQAWLIERLGARDRDPAVAFEMLSRAQRPALERWRVQTPGDVEALRAAVAWDDSGWPDWALYRPVFAAALAHGRSLHAADLDRARLRALRSAGIDAFESAFVRRHGLDRPLPAEVADDFRAAIAAAHCDMLPEAALPSLLLAQRARDAALADALLAAGPPAILIAGAGHTHDAAVPAYLRALAPERAILKLRFAEVRGDARAVDDYFGGEDEPGRWDYVWLTPRVDEIDPCERFREQLERMRRGHGSAEPGGPGD